MADVHKPPREHRRARHGHRTAWELARFITGLLLALLSAPSFWI
jgi:hypothetical protein